MKQTVNIRVCWFGIYLVNDYAAADDDGTKSFKKVKSITFPI